MRRLQIVLSLLMAALMLALAVKYASAHDPKHLYDEWMMRQVNNKNWRCCDGNDVVYLDDDQWGITKTYVFDLNGQHYNVPDELVVKLKWSDPNPTGKALAWFYEGALRCFAPSTSY